MNILLKDSNSIPYLRQIYKKRFKEDKELSESDIIYFLRNAILNSHQPIKINNKVVVNFSYEREVLTLVKAKEWDWHYTDIDKCNILTYAIFNKVDSVANYLIENKYDLSVYKEDVSHALTASIRINNIDYFKKIVESKNINTEYLIDLNVHSYIRKSANPTGLGSYNDYLNTLNCIHEPEMIRRTIESIIKSHYDFDKFLELQKFKPQLFIGIANKVLNENFKNIDKRKANQIMDSFSKYKLYHYLNNNLEYKKPKTLNKI